MGYKKGDRICVAQNRTDKGARHEKILTKIESTST